MTDMFNTCLQYAAPDIDVIQIATSGSFLDISRGILEPYEGENLDD